MSTQNEARQKFVFTLPPRHLDAGERCSRCGRRFYKMHRFVPKDESRVVAVLEILCTRCGEVNLVQVN